MNLEKWNKLIGRKMEKDEVCELLTMLGVAVEEIGQDYIKIEYNPNRPDFSSIYGLVRAAKGMLGISIGLPRYRVLKPRTFLRVDASVKSVRPIIAAAFIEGLNLSAEDIEDIIAMQEDLHWVVGRNRRKVAIGIHNAKAIKPPLLYRAVGPEDVSFVPLKGFRRMTPKEIIEQHEIGKKYGYILSGGNLFPIIEDSRGEVLSMPPIVNASLTELSEGTSDLFIDVTGTDENAVHGALNILVTSLADMGGKIRQVMILDGRKKILTPDLRSKMWSFKLSYARSLLGIDISKKDAMVALKRARIGIKKVANDSVIVKVPAYRVDIMHPVDLVEEIAIGLGYKNLVPTIPRTVGFGKYHQDTLIQEICREIMIGLGFTEVVNFTLSNSMRDYVWMRIEPERSVKVLNPVSADYDILRTWILPSLLSNLASNKKSLYPQKLFEIGDVLIIDDAYDEKVRRELRLAYVSAHSDATFSEIKSITEELMRCLGLSKWDIVEIDHASFIPGRVIKLEVDGNDIGIMGEIHPEVLENFGLTMPVSAAEINIERVFELLKRSG